MCPLGLENFIPVTRKCGVDSRISLTPNSLTCPSDFPPTASPHILSRGQTFFSMNKTFLPPLARYPAADEPPGPPPTTIASKLALFSGGEPLSIGCSHM